MCGIFELQALGDFLAKTGLQPVLTWHGGRKQDHGGSYKIWTLGVEIIVRIFGIRSSAMRYGSRCGQALRKSLNNTAEPMWGLRLSRCLSYCSRMKGDGKEK